MKRQLQNYKIAKLNNKRKLQLAETTVTYQYGTVLDIGYERLCKCPSNKLNCLSAKDWIKSQVAIWEFFYEKRDLREKDTHPAVFPIALPKKCIELFTHEGELVLDPFVGSGTALIAARDLNRNAVGFDLHEKYIDLCNERLAERSLFGHTKQIAVCDDAINIPKYLRENTVALSVTSPPYACMLNRPRLNKSIRGNLRENKYFLKIQQYSNSPCDLGTMEPSKYVDTLKKIYAGILPLLKPRAHCIINVTDLWWNDTRIPLHCYIIEALEEVGYDLRNIIIWDRRNLVNRAGIFGWPNNYITLGTTFEYILDFWNPSR